MAWARSLAFAAAAAALAAAGAEEAAASGAYDIGKEMAEEAFWKSDPVLFVKKREGRGFQFTSSAREGADTRLDGAVAWNGMEVYETKVLFGELGGVERVELMLYTPAGTEARREMETSGGKKIYRLERVEKAIDREGFFGTLKAARGKLTAEGAKPPKPVAEKSAKRGIVRRRQTWPAGAAKTVAELSWGYEQEGKKRETFKPGFIRLAVDGPGRGGTGAGRAAAAKGAKKITDNVIRDPRGDVFIDGVPMVDQGQKGYCAAATAERVLRYYGLDVDEHEIAQAAGTTAEEGTTTRAMKDSVQSIGKKYKLAAVVSYGDFEKSGAERIEGLVKEVENYNKAAKKLKKPAIGEDVYVRREGSTTIYSPAAADAAMDPEVLREMKVNGAQKSKFTRFMKDVRDQVGKGIPLIWGVTLGTYPEPDIPQARGGHMRLIVGYNDKRKEVLYSDSWGAGHELKRMPAEWAWTISHCLMYLKPLR